jgi:predicted nucleotide-binding protein (sugar kinase/HSP70/actin superfamily)
MLFQRHHTVRIAPPTDLIGKKLWVPRLQVGSSLLCAAVFRSMGIDAEVMPPSDARTLELGARFSSGDECYPLKLTLGDSLKVLTQPGNNASNTAFLVAIGQGPCRFGQYAPYFRSVFRAIGHPNVTFASPSFEKGYADFGESTSIYVRSGWRAIVVADILLKLLLLTRPYEIKAGSADAIYDESVTDLCAVFERRYPNFKLQMEEIQCGLLRARQRFRAFPRRAEANRRLLIGVIGEVYCRLNTFSNEELVRRFEAAGAELWMDNLGEWFWYTNQVEMRAFARSGRSRSLASLKAKIRNHVQASDEQVNVGKAIFFAKKGLDGVIDISPFACMNGIVGEALYPRVSRDQGGIPIRNFYFDGTQSELERDVGIFLELARNYRQREGGAR